MIKKIKKMGGKWLGITFIGFVLLIFGIAGYLVLFQSSQTENEVKTPRSRKVDSTPGGESSPEYARKIQEYNQKMAEDARNEGDSYLSTVSRDTDDSLSIDEEPQEEEQDQEESNNTTEETVHTEFDLDYKPDRSNQEQESQNNDEQNLEKREALKKAYSQQLKSIYDHINVSSGSPSTHVVEHSPENTQASSGDRQSDTEDQNNKMNEKENGANSIVDAGDVLYAVNDVEINSDLSSPVKATVVSGDLKNSSLIGEFERREKNLVISFNSLIAPDGERHNIDAVAVDPDVPKYAVQSRVDNHTIQKWGGLVAASFLEGFGEAVSRGGETTVVTDHSTSTSTPDYDTEEEMWVAGGKVGSRIANKLENQTDRPPTVYLDAGQPLGILILNNNNDDQR